MIKKIIFLIFLVSSQSFSQSIPYVILISFDGFRHDYSERGITPNLDLMKQEGIHALSLKPSFPTKTFPNHYSVISGMYPENHGIIFNSFIDVRTGERYKLGDTNVVRDSKWYLGEAFWETAERNGIKTASYFWPGSEMRLKHRRPTYYEHYEHERPYKLRINGILEWLQLPPETRPHFITLYFDATDTYGHKYGPEADETNEAISGLDSLIGLLYEGLNEIGLMDSTNLIIVSDHGMTEISTEKVINIEELLDNFDVEFGGSKPVMMINPKEQFDNVLSVLNKNQNHYKVYTKENIPDYYHFNLHPFIYPIILVADLGWSLVTNYWYNGMKKNYSNGNHGYDNMHTDMHGVFIAKGPNFKTNIETGTINNVDIYPLLCKIFKIQPRSNIDGKLNRIEYILK